MITGQISATREAVIRLRVRSTGGSVAEIEAVIDTGFTDSLTLPPSLIASLGLPYSNDMVMVLADGSPVSMGVYKAIVEWNGQDRSVPVHEVSGGPLVGMRLLYGHEVRLQVVDGGAVTIEALP